MIIGIPFWLMLLMIWCELSGDDENVDQQEDADAD
jgi:hypothetical protein